ISAGCPSVFPAVSTVKIARCPSANPAIASPPPASSVPARPAGHPHFYSRASRRLFFQTKSLVAPAVFARLPFFGRTIFQLDLSDLVFAGLVWPATAGFAGLWNFATATGSAV